MTALDLIKGSLRLIGAIATGETPSAAEANDSLSVLNDLLENWSTERLSVYRRVEVTHTLTAGVASYTIGAGADIDTDRPIRIVDAFIRDGVQDSPVTVVDDGLYAGLGDKSNQSLPEWLRYDAAFPTGTVTLWPVPGSAYGLHLITDMQFARLANVSAELSFPPGYARALRFGLAVELAPEFGVIPRADVVQIAADAKADIKRANKRQPIASIDAALLSATTGDKARFYGGT